MGTLRIVSRSERIFDDRVDAGRLLAEELLPSRGCCVVVLGIPRGGLVIAREVARALHGELDVVLARKLGAPGNPEVALGAVAEDGKVLLNDPAPAWFGADENYLEEQRSRILGEISRLGSTFRKIRPKVPLRDRRVIVTDDGAATGATMKAALWAVRNERPKEVIAALPVAPQDTVASLAEVADQCLCLCTPRWFYAVGQFYLRFEQVDDEQVIEILQEEAQREGGK